MHTKKAVGTDSLFLYLKINKRGTFTHRYLEVN